MRDGEVALVAVVACAQDRAVGFLGDLVGDDVGIADRGRADELVQASLLVGVLFQTGRVAPDKTVQLELSADDMYLDFAAVITSVKLGLSVGDVMSADIDFNVNGPLKTVELGGGAFRSVR